MPAGLEISTEVMVVRFQQRECQEPILRHSITPSLLVAGLKDGQERTTSAKPMTSQPHDEPTHVLPNFPTSRNRGPKQLKQHNDQDQRQT
jgi:hypothetical protein